MRQCQLDGPGFLPRSLIPRRSMHGNSLSLTKKTSAPTERQRASADSAFDLILQHLTMQLSPCNQPLHDHDDAAFDILNKNMRQTLLTLELGGSASRHSRAVDSSMASSSSLSSGSISPHMVMPLHLLLESHHQQQQPPRLQIVSDNAKSHKQFTECRGPPSDQREERPAFSPRSTTKSKLGPPRKPGRWESSEPVKLQQDCRPTMPAKRQDSSSNLNTSEAKNLAAVSDRFSFHGCAASSNKRTLRMPQRRLSFEQDLNATVQVIERVLSELDLQDEDDDDDDDDYYGSDQAPHGMQYRSRQTSDGSAATV